MRKRIAFISIVFLFAFGWTVAAQDVSSRQDATTSLKQQLMDVKLKETQLRMCLEELDEAEVGIQCIQGYLLEADKSPAIRSHIGDRD